MKPPSLKGLSFLSAANLFVASAICAAAQPKIRDAVTGNDLVQKHKEAAQQNPLASLDPRQERETAVADPTKVNQPKDLIATSDFLSFGGLSTLIPKRSILHVPTHFQDRVKFEKGSDIVVWPVFFRNNRGWIRTMEVTRAQAQGKEPFAEEVLESLRESSILVVATYREGPISVAPYTDPKAEEAAEGEANAEKNE
ncbi:MAG: hypothetical protein R3242_02910 [Akkermansiaceae bacterium]|nr:hypothetical protein [Akkermansiaceae bacterium]